MHYQYNLFCEIICGRILLAVYQHQKNAYRVMDCSSVREILLFPVDSCLFGDGCTYPCHCENDAPCDADTGYCPNGCDDLELHGTIVRGNWTGPGCQIGIYYGHNSSNVAILLLVSVRYSL